MRLSFCLAVALLAHSCIMDCSTGELGGDKHGGCLIDSAEPHFVQRAALSLKNLKQPLYRSSDSV